MRVRFRRYCYDCRRGASVFCRRRGKHNLWWDYYIFVGNTRLKQIGGFSTYERALVSAEAAWTKLKKAMEEENGSK